MRAKLLLLLFIATAAAVSLAQAAPLPAGVTSQLPAGYEVITYAVGQLTRDKRTDYLVALKIKNEAERSPKPETSPPRPLLLFTQGADGAFRLAKRNDHVVYGINDGGQCDPFEDDDGLVIKNQYFTVQNGVACGSHWTDYITFKYDPTLHDWVFSKRIFESWRMNPSNKPNADALIRDTKRVWSGDKTKPTLFEAYRPLE